MDDFNTPSEALEYWLKIRGVTAYQLSKDTALPQSRLSEIAAGRRRITTQTATYLGTYFETGPEYWMALQSKYDINESQKAGAVPSTCGGRLSIGGWSIRCYVLPDDRRVLAVNDVLEVVSVEARPLSIDRLASLIDSPFLRSKKIEQLRKTLMSPVKLVDANGIAILGYEGVVLIDFCRALLDVRRVGGLPEWAAPYAAASEVLIGSVAKVGIVALIDEATGNQNRRHKDALQRLLDAYFKEEYAAWTKKFPDWFYEEMFRLKHWKWDALSSKRPPIVGKLTKDIVYARLEAGVLEELERLNPLQDNGRRKLRHHQWLSQEIGHPALDAHFYALRGMMRAHHDWGSFYHILQLLFPLKNESLQLELSDYHPN